MRMRILSVVSAVFLSVFARLSFTAPIPAELDLNAVRTIQPYALDDKSGDAVYVLVTGVANGKEISGRYPQEKSLPAAAKKLAVTEKAPLSLWKGELDDGEFALLTVTVFQGAGADDAKEKAYVQKLTDADKQAAGWTKKTLDQAGYDALAKDVLKANRSVITKIKDMFPRGAKTDHYGGQFTVVLWNHGGKLTKRLDPVGLTFGEHFGTDVKIYTKLKNTRNNVLIQDEKGQWSQQSLTAVSDDDTTIRVKMLEIETIKGASEPTKHVTDYLAELQVNDLSGGKKTPLKWELEGEQTGYDAIHTYWDFAD